MAIFGKQKSIKFGDGLNMKWNEVEDDTQVSDVNDWVEGDAIYGNKDFWEKHIFQVVDQEFFLRTR